MALTGIFLLGMHDDLYESGGTPCNNQGHLHFHLSDKKVSKDSKSKEKQLSFLCELQEKEK